jgi:hypothetical protein
MDRDPELDVTVSDGRQVLTFQIAALAGRDGWVIVEPRTPRRVIHEGAAALEVRQRLDTQIAARLAAGWVPVDRRPAGPSRVASAPLSPDLVLQISSLLEALARARSALQAADPSGQLWATCHLFRQQAWRVAVGGPRTRVARARRERRLAELAEQRGDLAAARLHYRAALASYARVGVTRRLAQLAEPAAPAPTRPAGGLRWRRGAATGREAARSPLPARTARTTTSARGQLVCRVDPVLNARVRAHAARAGQTLSTFLTRALALALAREPHGR